VGPRAGLNRRKTSSPPGIDPRPPSSYSVAIPTDIIKYNYIRIIGLPMSNRGIQHFHLALQAKL